MSLQCPADCYGKHLDLGQEVVGVTTDGCSLEQGSILFTLATCVEEPMMAQCMCVVRYFYMELILIFILNSNNFLIHGFPID